VIEIKPATLAWMEALTEGDRVFTERFGIPVVPGWAGFPEAVSVALDGLRSSASGVWGTHLFFDNGELVGFGGWKGPPHEGSVELGYAVAPARQGRGIATAVVRELVARAGRAGVGVVVAHTLPDESASTTVLHRCGFARVGDVLDPDAGLVWRFELALTACG
jgi:RimJ/RimL family protein N-acetyltransferase